MDDARSNRTSFSTTQLSISIPMPRCEFPTDPVSTLSH
jgi:hypothetical protein